MLDPKNLWMAMAAFALVFLGWKTLNPPPADTGEPFAMVALGYGADMRFEKINRTQCTGTGDRIWLTHKDGNDCVTVILPPSLKGGDKSAESAIVFIDGDVPDSEQSTSGDERSRATYKRVTETLSDKFAVPVLVLARPGVLGSSGVHMAGGRRDDVHVIDSALEELKRRFGIKRIIMAGQSGGSRMIAQLLVMGRRDIVCGVMGSGAYDVPTLVSGGRTSTNIFGDPGRRFLVPMLMTQDIAVVPSRRLFVIGDRRDLITRFDEQQAWAAKLDSLGHHVVLIEGEAKDAKHHGVTRATLDAAGLCAQGKPDADIVTAAGKRIALVRQP